MRNTSTDNFEAIAQDAVTALIAAALTTKMMGETELAHGINDKAADLIDRAIALVGR